MFRFYHTYMPEIWEGNIKNGFIDETSGIRLPLNIEYENLPDRLFNNIAKKDGTVWNIVKDGKLGLYVDRLSGGIYYFDYRPDKALIEDYKNLCGDSFLGFQLHEWASNYLGEFKKLFNAKLCEWSPEAIKNAYKSLHPDLPHLMIESMSIDELCSLYPPSNIYHLFKNLDYLFKSRCEKTDNSLITCDSNVLGFDYELKNGARNIMCEIGGQTEDARLQISYARGVSKAHGKNFGTYYEPWGGKPLRAVKYGEDNSEWQPVGELQFAYSQGNEKEGSTRSLQRRLHFYSYFAGAEFMSEEWCANTTFYDWQDFALTPYGQIKKEFLDFVKKYDIGKPITPMAAVLPKEYVFINGIHEVGDFYMNMPIYGDLASKVRAARSGLCALFSDKCPMQGNEYKERTDVNHYIMANSQMPDAIDIIHEDSKTIGDYEYLVDLTSNGLTNKNVIDISDAKNMLLKALPCAVEGNAHWLVTKNEDRHYVIIFNNDGVFFDAENGEYALKECAHKVKIAVKDNRKAELIYGNTQMRYENGEYFAGVPAGDFIVIGF